MKRIKIIDNWKKIDLTEEENNHDYNYKGKIKWNFYHNLDEANKEYGNYDKNKNKNKKQKRNRSYNNDKILNVINSYLKKNWNKISDDNEPRDLDVINNYAVEIGDGEIKFYDKNYNEVSADKINPKDLKKALAKIKAIDLTEEENNHDYNWNFYHNLDEANKEYGNYDKNKNKNKKQKRNRSYNNDKILNVINSYLKKNWNKISDDNEPRDLDVINNYAVEIGDGEIKFYDKNYNEVSADKINPKDLKKALAKIKAIDSSKE